MTKAFLRCTRSLHKRLHRWLSDALHFRLQFRFGKVFLKASQLLKPMLATFKTISMFKLLPQLIQQCTEQDYHLANTLATFLLAVASL